MNERICKGHCHEDLTGRKFGMLTVLSFHSRTYYISRWNCRCDCGKECIKNGYNIQTGKTVSCGCEHKRKAKELGQDKAADLIGKRFGRLIVISRAGSNVHQKTMWLCKCDCGNEKILIGCHLTNSNSKSCGCIQKEVMSGIGKNRVLNLVGRKFGRMMVLSRYGNGKRARARWLCRCDCGTEKVVNGMDLTSESTTSCGCYRIEIGHTMHWNPNITQEERESSRCRSKAFPGIIRWRVKILRRDGYRCVICGGDKNKKLVVHHKEAWGSNKVVRPDIDNGVTSCERCHIEFHQKYGYGNNTVVQWDEFVASKQSIGVAI